MRTAFVTTARIGMFLTLLSMGLTIAVYVVLRRVTHVMAGMIGESLDTWRWAVALVGLVAHFAMFLLAFRRLDRRTAEGRSVRAAETAIYGLFAVAVLAFAGLLYLNKSPSILDLPLVVLAALLLWALRQNRIAASPVDRERARC